MNRPKGCNFIKKEALAQMFSCEFQPCELGKKYDGNFIFTFAIVKARYGGITSAKNFKHGNYLK